MKKRKISTISLPQQHVKVIKPRNVIYTYVQAYPFRSKEADFGSDLGN